MVTSGQLSYAAEEGMTILTLDYLGKELQFVIVLPDEGQTTEAAAARLTPEHFARWSKLGDTGRRNVTLYLPKFKIQGGTVDLTEALQQLGMGSAFDVPPGSANFEGIAPRLPDEYLYVSKVFHKTFVVVEESGTEAAAATAVVIGAATVSAPATRLPPTVVRVERPFLFAIQHCASGACLFIGRIADP
jgi:serpin B